MKESRRWGGWGGITCREMPDTGDRGMEAAKPLAMYVPMQQSCVICTYTPEPKVQLKTIKIKNEHMDTGRGASHTEVCG